VSASAWFHTSDPGVFVVDYPTGITGPPNVEAEGTRVWRNGLKHGQYLARASAIPSRKNVAFFVEVNLADVSTCHGAVSNAFNSLIIAESAADTQSRDINWSIQINPYRVNNTNTTYRFVYIQSRNSTSGETVHIGPSIVRTAPTVERLIAVLPDPATDANVYFYNTTGTAADVTVARFADTTDAMDTAAKLIMCLPCKLAKMEGGIPSQSQREAFQSAGTLPSGLAASYQGGHEIDPAAPVFYDTSGNATALDLSDVDVQYWPEAAASGDFTDTGFTSPLVEVPLTIAADCTAGVHEITLRRTRVGIPARVPALSDAVLYDDGTLPVTVVAIPAVVHTGPVQIIQARMSDNPVAYVQITSDREGTVDISCDRTVIDFPLTAIIGPTLEVTIEGAILKGGDCDVTAVMV
jgi:hypothetical protein